MTGIFHFFIFYDTYYLLWSLISMWNVCCHKVYSTLQYAGLESGPDPWRCISKSSAFEPTSPTFESRRLPFSILP
jgi:hypothetical protein